MKEINLPATDRKNKLHVVIWEPDTDIRAIVQISHGMIEYVTRYDEFAEFLNKHGILVIGNDHLGHGLTASGDDDLGYFCENNMSRNVVADLHRVTIYAKKHYGNGIPYVLFGHSMGSFMARRYMMTYGNELDGIILAGTGRQSWLKLAVGMLSVGIIGAVKGDRHRTTFLRKAAFNRYNSHIENPRSDNDWISKDMERVDKYNADKYCTFLFTVNGYKTLLETLAFIQNPRHIKHIPKKLPILMISGDEDPVGNYGKGVKQVYRTYKRAGIRNIKVRLYKDDRHELINEIDRVHVFNDVLKWIDLYIV